MSPALTCNWNTFLSPAACGWWRRGLQGCLKNVQRKWVTAPLVTKPSAVCKHRHFSRWHSVTVVARKKLKHPFCCWYSRPVSHHNAHAQFPFWKQYARVNPRKLNSDKGRSKADLAQIATSYLHACELCCILCQTNRLLFKRYSLRAALCPKIVSFWATISLFSSFSWLIPCNVKLVFPRHFLCPLLSNVDTWRAVKHIDMLALKLVRIYGFQKVAIW